ncbi:amino acid dehydrogenase [Thalassotalea insulae]|uniref:Amino acid dehydrogenase n=1 Tax=Thalassotalea insulae TaxID=2056778 RepID=A0ABQ6GY28_9GAMM|nr:FAD-dependent oxidoreductase [Thalassotalea insulae]GLX79531.1 amino acid dehydrogenase [Thalassotalea insulae]
MQTQDQDNKHIAVIGAGIVGINCAIALQSQGYQVTLLDKEGIGLGCSKGNAGHFATEQVFPLAEAGLLLQLPKMLLDPLGPVALSPKHFPKALPWFIRFIANMFSAKRVKNTAALKSLNEQAINYYKPLLKAANAEHLLTENGSLLVFEHTPIHDIEAIQQSYLSQGVKVELLDREQTFALEPKLNSNIQHALYFTEVAHTISPLDLSQTLADYAIQLGCRFQQFEVCSISHQPDGVTLKNNEQQLHFDQVIIATGAWSESLLKQLGYKLPIEGERGYSLDLSEQTIGQLTRPVASAERRFIITPMSHGLRLAGTVEFAGLKQKANMKRALMLHKNASYILSDLPALGQQSHQGWLGFRPSLPDSLPVIGKAPKHKNINLALGHQHLGLTLGAITGKLIAQVVAEQPTDIDIQPFCLSRFN